MENFGKELNDKKKEFGRHLFWSLLGTFLLYIVLFAWLQKEQINLPKVIPVPILILCFIATGYIGYLFTKTTFSFKATYTIVAITFFCLIFYLCMLLCHVSNAIYYFYIPILLLILLISNVKATAITGVCIFLLSIFTKKIAEFFNISTDSPVPPEYKEILQYLEWMEIFVVGYLSFFILYYYSQIHKIEESLHHTLFLSENISEDDKQQRMENPGNINDDTTVKNADKLHVLYHQIINCFESEKPYQCPAFNIRKLAELLDSNSTYISLALNKIGNQKFNQLTNEYRVKQVKEEIGNNIHQKFTIEHIYTQAGFRQQSTFNRIFKEQTGMTPSDFIEEKQQSI
jgi:AraC-like DNA-binding protein